MKDDLISRQDAIDALNRDEAYDEDIPNRADGVRDAIITIMGLPSAQTEREKGEWIPVTNGRGGHECKICHNYAPSYQTWGEWLTDFCPICGSDMRGGKE